MQSHIQAILIWQILYTNPKNLNVLFNRQKKIETNWLIDQPKFWKTLTIPNNQILNYESDIFNKRLKEKTNPNNQILKN
jgi:hypothetical protein